MFELFESFINWLWTYPVLVILVGGGIVMTFTLKFFNLLSYHLY